MKTFKILEESLMKLKTNNEISVSRKDFYRISTLDNTKKTLTVMDKKENPFFINLDNMRSFNVYFPRNNVANVVKKCQKEKAAKKTIFFNETKKNPFIWNGNGSLKKTERASFFKADSKIPFLFGNKK